MKYQCTDCGAEYANDKTHYLCPICEKENLPHLPPKGVLKVIYDYDKLQDQSFSDLKNNHFLDLLPIKNYSSMPNLKVGNTPLYPILQLEGENLPFSLYLKDDSQNPTFSFKDRASALVSAYAKENGINTIVAASTGNAGSSLAGSWFAGSSLAGSSLEGSSFVGFSLARSSFDELFSCNGKGWSSS